MKAHSTILAALLLAAAPAFANSGDAPPTKVSIEQNETGIAWFKGDVDSAFAKAKAENKPVFLYWGAVWCPACNQVKATIFNRQTFIDRSRFFVPVYIDGDSPGAQKLGARFKVRGYPSMILFRPDGSEVTRLPGEVDSERYMRALALAMNATHSVKDLLQSAQKEPSKLRADDWRLLSFHSWDTDQQLVSEQDLAATLQALATACPPGDNATRLNLLAWVANANAKPASAAKIDKESALERLIKILGDQRMTHDNLDILINYASELTEFLSTAATRDTLLKAWQPALERLSTDSTLSKTDRISALAAKVGLARLITPTGALDPALVKTVRERVAETDRTTTNVFERQAVISAAAHTLTVTGLLDDSDALLKAELKRSHSPFYYMSSLAQNAEQRNDKAGAIAWYEQAYQGAKGPATRLQWGGALLRGLLRLSPDDETKIENVSQSVFTELASTPDAFYDRNSKQLARLGTQFVEWNKTGKHDKLMQRIQAQIKDLCAKVPTADGQRSSCESTLQVS